MSGPAVGSQCTVCNHPQATEINVAVASGQPRRVVARRFALGHDALNRHYHHGHPGVVAAPEPLRKTLPAGEGATPRENLEAVIAMYGAKLRAGTLRVDEARELRVASAALDEMGGGEAPVPQTWREVGGWQELEAEIFAALEPFPEARQALACALAGEQQG